MAYCVDSLPSGRSFMALRSYRVASRGAFSGFRALRNFRRDITHCDHLFNAFAILREFSQVMNRCYKCHLASLYWSYIPAVPLTPPFSLLSHPCFQFHFFSTFSFGSSYIIFSSSFCRNTPLFGISWPHLLQLGISLRDATFEMNRCSWRCDMWTTFVIRLRKGDLRACVTREMPELFAVGGKVESLTAQWSSD